MPRSKLPGAAFLIIRLLIGTACDLSSSESETNEIALSGTVRYMGIEGVFSQLKATMGQPMIRLTLSLPSRSTVSVFELSP